MRPPGSRWIEPLGSWVRDYGGVERVRTAVSSFGVPITSRAVYGWVEGRATPRPIFAAAIVALSDGRVSFEAIYRISSVPS